MEIRDIDAKIQVKQTEISVESDSTKKYRLQQELQALQLKKQIASFKKQS